MKLTKMANIRVSQTNQTKIKLQNTPAFKGTINVLAENLEKAPYIYNIVDTLEMNLVFEGAKVVSNDLSKGNKGHIAIEFSDHFNEIAEALVETLNPKFNKINWSDVNIHFRP